MNGPTKDAQGRPLSGRRYGISMMPSIGQLEAAGYPDDPWGGDPPPIEPPAAPVRRRRRRMRARVPKPIRKVLRRTLR